MAPPRGRQAPEPPHNLEAEEYLIGAMMISPHAIDACAELVSRVHFYRESHGLMFETMLRMRDEGGRVDAVTLCDRLELEGTLAEVGGKDRVRDIATLVPATANAAHHAAIVREKALYRGLTVAGVEVARLGWQPDAPAATQLERAEALVFDLARQNERSDFVTLADTVPEAWAELERLHAGGEKVVGVPSGLKDVDELTAGFMPGNLIVVAGRPSMGKSALALSIISHVVLHDDPPRPVAIFSLEMTRQEVTQRIVSLEARVDLRRIRNGQLTSDDFRRAAEAAGRLPRAPLYIDDGRLVTHSEIRSKSRRLRLAHPDLAMVVVDYLQVLAPAEGEPQENRVQAIAQITRSLKILAGELEVPVVLLSQLSRAPDARHDSRPILSDLRDSGAVEQDADVVLLLYRDEYYHPEDTDQQGIAEINVAKQRNGPTGTVKTHFEKKYTRFGDLAKPSAAPPEPVQEAFA